MDDWGFEHLGAWLERRVELPVGPLFCVIDGATKGHRAWSATAVRGELRRLALEAGVRRRFAPHQLRHAHAVELAREGIAVNLIQRQLGHTDLGTTSTYPRASIPPRSSRQCIHAGHRRSRPPRGFGSELATLPLLQGWVREGQRAGEFAQGVSAPQLEQPGRESRIHPIEAVCALRWNGAGAVGCVEASAR